MPAPDTAPAPTFPCPVDGCDFAVPLDLPALQRSPYIRDDAAPLAFQEAALRASTVAADRVSAQLEVHGATDHDPCEFEAALHAVAAGLRE